MNTQSCSAHSTRRPAARRLHVLLLAAACWAPAAAPAPPAHAAEIPADAVKVLDRFVEATGGKAAHDSIRNSVSRLTLTLPAQDVSFAMTVYAARPNQIRTVLESPMIGKIESGVSGDVVWDLSSMTGPRLRDGQERADGLRDAAFDPMSRWREVYPAAVVSGTDSVGGLLCDKVVLTPATGQPRTTYFDRRSGLLRRVDMTIESQSGTASLRTLLDDYRKVGGILVAHRMEIEAMGQKRVMVTDSIAHNVDLPAGAFDLPPEIRKLLEAKAKE